MRVADWLELMSVTMIFAWVLWANRRKNGS